MSQMPLVPSVLSRSSLRVTALVFQHSKKKYFRKKKFYCSIVPLFHGPHPDRPYLVKFLKKIFFSQIFFFQKNFFQPLFFKKKIFLKKNILLFYCSIVPWTRPKQTLPQKIFENKIFSKKNFFFKKKFIPFFYYCIVVLLKCIPTRTHTHTHKTTFVIKILLIELSEPVTSYLVCTGQYSPGRVTPGQIFGKCLKLHWLSNQPINRSPARLEGPKKEGLK